MKFDNNITVVRFLLLFVQKSTSFRLLKATYILFLIIIRLLLHCVNNINTKLYVCLIHYNYIVCVCFVHCQYIIRKDGKSH